MTVQPPTHGQLTALIVDDDIESWQAAGFTGQDVVQIGSTTIVPTAAGVDRGDGHRSGIVGACVAGIGELDGLALGSWQPEAEVEQTDHRNGVVAIDHVVVMTPDSDRTTPVSYTHLTLPTICSV